LIAWWWLSQVLLESNVLSFCFHAFLVVMLKTYWLVFFMCQVNLIFFFGEFSMGANPFLTLLIFISFWKNSWTIFVHFSQIGFLSFANQILLFNHPFFFRHIHLVSLDWHVHYICSNVVTYRCGFWYVRQISSEFIFVTFLSRNIDFSFMPFIHENHHFDLQFCSLGSFLAFQTFLSSVDFAKHRFCTHNKLIPMSCELRPSP
jgi:hypothetical protein